MPTFPTTVTYDVSFSTEGRANLGIGGTPGGMTIDVSWNGEQVYGPANTNASAQSDISVVYTPGEANTLRVKLTDDGDQPYSKSGISGSPGQSSAGSAPQV